MPQIRSYLSLHDEDVDAAFAALKSDMVRLHSHAVTSRHSPLHIYILHDDKASSRLRWPHILAYAQEWEVAQKMNKEA